MKADKMRISLEAELGSAVRDAARRGGQSLSSWLAEAATAKLRSESLRDFLDAWEGEHGQFSDEEIARARAELGLPGEVGSR